MKQSLLARIGAGFLMGGVLALVPLGTAQAAEYDFYDSLRELSGRAYTQGGDMYESMEPTSAGPQGPVRTDMMKDYGAYDSGDYRYKADKSYSGWSQWNDLNRRMGPIGGYGTN